MATRASIEFDFARAKAQAGELDALAGRLSTLSEREFGNTLQGVAANWKGDNSRVYLNKGTKLQGDMKLSSQELRRIADDIRTIATKLYNAEMAALAIAEKREY